MPTNPQMKSIVCAIAILMLFSVALTGCGESQGVKTLSAYLVDFSQTIEDYKSSVSSDKSKQAEWDGKIDAMKAKWVDMRNEFGAEITPQQMEKMVQQYETMMASFTEFKQNGS